MQHRPRQWKRKLIRALDLPADADGGAVKVTQVGNTDLLVENHTGVLRCGNDTIRLQSPCGVIRIEGKDLQLSEFGPERAYVRGLVRGWAYEDGD